MNEANDCPERANCFARGRNRKPEHVVSGANDGEVGSQKFFVEKLSVTDANLKHVKKVEVCLILHNIRSIHNVGSIFRTADACGVDKIFLTGYTPIPVDRFGRDVKALSKVSLGAEKTVPWEKFSNIKKLIEKLQKEGVSIVALEQDDRSVNYKKFKPKFPLALIVGNEVRGVSKDVLSLCDSIIEIPMRGEKESLNVSVATGIALFQIVN